MDYDETGFDLGIIGGNQPPIPKYEPPEPPAAGFTRTPAEDEVVVCPNCGDELAMGVTEKKQEVWVIKSCGHVSPISTPDLGTAITNVVTGILWRMRSPPQ